MNKPVRISIIVAVILLILGGGVYGWRVFANSRKLSELQAKAKEMMSQPRDAGPRPEGDRGGREGFREMREQVDSLPEAYQQEFRQSMGNMFMAREEQKMDEYLKLSKPERKKHLDKLIIEDEKRRKEWEARSKQREAERSKQASTGGGERRGGPDGASGRGGPAGGGPGGASGGSGGSGGPGGGGPPNGGERRGGWGGRGGSMSARLDSTSPEFRAKRTEFRRDMEQRRKELGLPADQRGPRR